VHKPRTSSPFACSSSSIVAIALTRPYLAACRCSHAPISFNGAIRLRPSARARRRAHRRWLRAAARRKPAARPAVCAAFGFDERRAQAHEPAARLRRVEELTELLQLHAQRERHRAFAGIDDRAL